MKKLMKKIVLVAILAFCFQPMSINADCIIRNGETVNGVCRPYTDDRGSTGYRCLDRAWHNLWGSCNVSSNTPRTRE